MRTARWTLIAMTVAWLAYALALPPLAAQQAGPASPAASGPASVPASAGATLKLKHLTLDRAKRQIVIDAEVCYNPGPLEVLLCKSGTKDYESILRTQALPSDIHAALLALDLCPGKPARMSRADTQPAKALPPDGAKVSVTLRWKDKDEKPQEAPAGAWLILAKQKGAVPKDWVFVGSDVLPGGRYWADQDGDIVSLSNFASTVIDVPFESTAENANLEFTANEKAIPPKGTAVEVVLQVAAGGPTAAAARTLVEIDRFGRCWIEGRKYGMEQLGPWAQKYLEKHAEGMVVLRADGEARIGDLERAKDQLRMAGVAEMDEQKLMGPEEPLPRTDEQAVAAMKQWKDKFARWDRLLMDPFEESQETLQAIQQELKEMDARKAMLGEYAAHLKAALSESKAATQAAPK